MKKRFALIALLLVFSIFTMTACDLLNMIPGFGGEQGGGGDENPHVHEYVDGACSCGDPDPDYVPPHQHSFVDGKCECGESDPDYVPPHQHSFVDGKCECGESDPDYVPPHQHSFVDGKCECGESDPNYVPEVPDVLTETKIYLVGDSTVCSFADNYYYPRYGYGTQLANYLAPEATVVNLALSGRSSKSFVTEANYQTLKDSLKEGDYLIIGFGHNDEKSEDDARFSDASKDYTVEGSFGYNLYNYYIKLALDAGATPILCTPVVRAKTSDDYSGNEGHVTATGDYAQAIRDLGAAVGVSVVDLTAITKAEYESKGYDYIKNYHAVTVGIKDDAGNVVADFASIDKTHLNILGAKFVAYNLAVELSEIGGIGRYVLADITAPTLADLVVNPDYVYSDYKAPSLSDFGKQDHFSTTTEGWYGTAFGDTGGDPTSTSNGYYATETSEGVFKVGQTLASGSNKGKFSTTADGFAFLFRQVEADKNFTVSATVTILNTAAANQSGFGIMLRDDVYLPTKNASIISNYLTAGVLCGNGNATALFLRENSTLSKGQSFGSDLPKVGDVYTMTIERVGQSVTLTVTQGSTTVSSTYYDFDLFAKDGGYMYVGMFATRGTVIECTDVHFEITGTSQGA